MRTPFEDTLYYRLVVRNAGRPAVTTEEGTYTYDDIRALSSRFCGLLEKTGVAEGDVVLLAAHDSLEFVVAFVSCLRAGVVVAPVDPFIDEKELRRLIALVRPRKVLCTGGLYRRLKHARAVRIGGDNDERSFKALMARQRACPEPAAGPAPGSPALILFSSGTTGRPKGAVHSHAGLLVDTFARTVLRLTGKDTVFCCARKHAGFGHSHGLVFPFLAGARVILSRPVPHPAAIAQALRKRPTVLSAVPSMYALMLEYARLLRPLLERVRVFVVTGERLDPALCRRWEQTFGSPLLECYGNIEMNHSFISHIPGRRNRPGSGTLLEGFSARPGPGGRLRFAGPCLFTGYYRDPELTRRRLSGGWYLSDDIGSVARGRVHITGRASLVVKRHGKWVSLPEIEGILNALPGVAESMAAMTDGRLRYYVRGEKDGDPAAVERAIRRRFARMGRLHLLPDAVHFVAAIPKTRTGKISRAAPPPAEVHAQ